MDKLDTSYGTHTLIPTSPYNPAGFGEFYLAKMDDKGAWTGFISADHSTGSGGLSVMTDVVVAPAGEIYISGYFYGEISFGPPGPNSLISNLNAGYHSEGFIAKAGPFGNWMWA